MVNRSLLDGDFIRIKTWMGLDRFEVREPEFPSVSTPLQLFIPWEAGGFSKNLLQIS